MRSLAALCLVLLTVSCVSVQAEDDIIRVGMIGLDTSHSIAFTKVMNSTDEGVLGKCRVVAAYPHGSADIESSVSRIPQYTEEMQKMGIEIVAGIPDLLEQCDAVLLETNDGRPHLEQLIPVLQAGKPCFIDKPIAGSLADCLAIFQLSEHYKVPVFSSSSLRFGRNTQEVRAGSLGKIVGCSTWSPCSLEETHPDLFWYGIHGVESLFTVMGPGVETVTRNRSENFELVTGVWNDGRIGTFRGQRAGHRSYGGTAFGTKKTAAVGSYDGYAPLVEAIATFFDTRELPFDSAETIDIYAFMEAADESKRQNGNPVSVADVKAKAAKVAAEKVAAAVNGQ